MNDPKALKLFQEILDKTSAGRLKWESTASETAYSAVLPGGFSVTIWEFVDTDWKPPSIEDKIALVLRGMEGDLLRITTDIDGVTWEDLHKLYELAKRQALALDAKVDKLLGELAKM
jgi:hypothetical protein